MTRVLSLDGLRALAVVAVVWHHTHPTGMSSPLATRGYLGVDVFFVISGYLITALLLREQRERGTVRLRRFWMRRALRLFPLWYAILGALTVTLLWIHPGAAVRAAFFGDLPWNATYTSNFIVGGTLLSVSWSLAMEEQFYLVWPPLLTRARAAVPSVLLVAVGLSVGVHLGAFDHLFEGWIGPQWRQLAALTATVFPLVLGCGVALALDGRGDAPPWTRPLRGGIVPIALMVGIVAVASSPLGEAPMRLVAQLLAGALVTALVVGGERRDRWLSLPPLRWVGERSYGVYLLHMLVLQGVFAMGLAPNGERGIEVFAVTLALTIVAAGVSYRVLESPFLRLKNRFR